MTTLGACCELNPKRPRNIDDELKVSFVPMPAISEDGKIDCSNIKTYKEVRKGFTYFAENDVIFAKITPCMENGKGAVAKGLSGGIGSGSTEFHVLRPIEGKSNPYWLYIITMFKSFRVGARKVMTGTGGQLRVPVGYLRDFPISLPPISLQDSFEGFVHQSDKSKFACLKSQFIEMFKYINHDEYKTLDDVCILITDGTHNPPKFVESGIPFILVSNITGNIVTYETPKYITENDYRVLMKRTPIEKGDVLLSTVGSYGHPAIVTEDRPFAFQRHIAHLKPNRDLLTSEYLHAAILSSIVQEQIEILILGVAQKTLNLSAIRQIQIPVPSIEEQNVFVSFVEQSDKSK